MQKSNLHSGVQVNYRFDANLLSQFKSISRGELVVLEMYNYYLPFFKTADIAAVDLNFRLKNSEVSLLEQTLLLNILAVQVDFDAGIYVAASSRERKKFLLDLIHNSLLTIAQERGWSTEPFTQAREMVIEKEFKFQGCWKTPLSNPNRTYRSQICWEYETTIQIFVEITNRENKDERRYLLSVLPSLPALASILGQLKWQDNQTVILHHTNKRDFWMLDVVSGALEFCYPRAIQGDPHGLYDLGIMYLEGHLVLKDRERGINLIRQAADKQFGRALKKLARLEIGQ